jgi:hypothetical protein
MVRIRPSGVSSFYNCPLQWKLTHLDGLKSIPNSRAMIGTAVHKVAEITWKEAIESGAKDLNESKSTDIASETFKELDKEGMKYNGFDTFESCQKEAIEGAKCFTREIAPKEAIPKAVEKFYSIDLQNGFEIAGSVDYVGVDMIADLKTTRKKATPNNYLLQQSIYAVLSGAKECKIQNIVLKKKPESHILPLEHNIKYTKKIVNDLITRIKSYQESGNSLLFPANPTSCLCSDKYCSFFGTDKCEISKLK